MFSAIKKKIPVCIKKPAKTIIVFFDRIITKVLRKFKKIFRQQCIIDVKKNSYIFAILCIKKTVYADLAIDNINSLHYLNPSHTIEIYCDTLCFNQLQRKIKEIDYPKKVTIKDKYGLATKPWQHYKIETHIQAAWNNQILVDADSIWHDDPIVDKEKITILVVAHKIRDQKNEIALMENVFNKPEWTDFNHYVSAFVSIPTNLMTKKTETDLRYFNETIFNDPLTFIKDVGERENFRRLSEEFAVNIALQTNFSPDKIATLKIEDGNGNKKSLQSLYYGSMNKIFK